MTRARWILAALVLALVAGALWLLRDPAGGRERRASKPEAQPERGAERTRPTPELAPAPFHETPAEPASRAEPARAPVVAEPVATPAGPTWEVAVVEAGSLRPVANAGVWLRPGGNADPLALGALPETEAPHRTDAAGRVRVPAGGEQRIVAAREGARCGVARVEDPAATVEVRVELHPDFDLPVEVRHAGGAPAEGVPVALSVPPGPRWRASERTTDAEGRVTFAHVGLKMALEREPMGEVRVARALDAPLAQALDARRPPSAPVVFRLPPCATVDVRVRGADGQPAADGTRLALAHLPPGTERDVSPFAHGEREYLEAETKEGLARFACVELGGELEILVRSEGQTPLARVFRPAPARSGAHDEHELALGLTHAVLVYRVLDETGALLADERLSVRREHRSGWNHSDQTDEQRTDAEGRLRVELLDPFREGDRRHLTVEARAGAIGARLDLGRPFEPGELDQGDLRLAPPPLVAAGRVTDAGQGVAGAALTLHHPVLDEDGRSIWYWQDWSRVFESGSGGAFEVRAFLEAPELRLEAHKEALRSTVAAFEPGALGLELVLQRGGWIAGRVRLDEGVPVEGISLELRPAGTAGNVPEEQSASVEPDGRFQFSDLSPGTYDLSLGVRGQEGVASVAGLVVLPGEGCRDARLELDLRGRIHWMRFVLVPPAPADALNGSLRHWPSGTSGQRKRYHWFQGSPVDLLALDERIDLILTVPGYRPVRLEGVSEGREILLQAAPTARLQLPPGVRLPEPPFFVKATLVYEDEESGLDFGGAAFDERREIVCRAPGPGKLVVRWIAEKRGSSGASATTMEGIPAQYVELVEDAGEPLFVLAVDDATLQAALASCGL
ncbi:MAG TPA: hypothetical protein VF530_07615 [Planctomycetota bacterium]